MLPETPAAPLPAHVMRQTHLLPGDEMSSGSSDVEDIRSGRDTALNEALLQLVAYQKFTSEVTDFHRF